MSHPSDPTMKQLWLAAYTSLLTRFSPEEAVSQAHYALQICNETWRDPEWVWTTVFKGDPPVGARFSENPLLPPNNAPTSDFSGSAA